MHIKGFFKCSCSIILSLLITSCDAGFKEDKKDDKILTESNKILSEYEKVQGEYEGVLRLSVDDDVVPVNIRVTLRPDVSFGGGRSDGELVPEVTLRGHFEILDYIWPKNDVNYEGRYWYAQDGRILMSGKDGEMGFIVYPDGNHLVKGVLSEGSRELGEFEATLVSKDVKAPGEGQDEERRKRLKESYANLLGSYTGKINNPLDPEKHRRNLPLRFRFFLAGSTIRATVDNPRSDADRLRPLTVETFRPDTGLIILKGVPMGVGTVPGYGEFYAHGYLGGNTLNFDQLLDHLGPLGTYEGSKDLVPTP